MNQIFEKFQKNGFAVIEKSIDRETVAFLSEAVSSLNTLTSVKNKNDSVYGVRNLLNISPEIKEFSKSDTVKKTADLFLGAKAKVVRAIYFNKTSDANWKVPWHQDLTISVREKRESHGFTAWTMKADIHHVQPPKAILENMIALRFHLDDTDETNGALKIIPKTHTKGRLSAGEIKIIREANESVICRVKQGDCLIMRPLILHSSSAGTNPKNRRVIHLEFSACDLPNGLEFYGS